MLRFPVHACTDVTGFGLVGHASKMAQGSRVTIIFEESDLPLLPGTLEACREGMIPGGGARNRDYFGAQTKIADEVGDELVAVAFDPQTSGGLLIAVAEDDSLELLAQLHDARVTESVIIGRAVEAREFPIELA